MFTLLTKIFLNLRNSLTFRFSRRETGERNEVKTFLTNVVWNTTKQAAQRWAHSANKSNLPEFEYALDANTRMEECAPGGRSRHVHLPNSEARSGYATASSFNVGTSSRGATSEQVYREEYRLVFHLCNVDTNLNSCSRR